MSDPGWCGKHNYRSQTTDAVCPQCKRERESADEIEQWKAFEAVLRKRLGARDHETSLDLIARTQRRIEELEREFNFWHSVALDYKRDLGEYMRRGPDSLTWEPISHAQIDAAWNYTGDDWDCGRTVEIVLAELGIVRCNCLKWGHINGVCQNCNGHGWVIGGEDE